jgi:hypothetical protein
VVVELSQKKSLTSVINTNMQPKVSFFSFSFQCLIKVCALELS